MYKITHNIIAVTGLVLTLSIASLSAYAMGPNNISHNVPQARMTMSQTQGAIQNKMQKQPDTMQQQQTMGSVMTHDIVSNYEPDHIYYKDMNLDFTEPDYVN